MFGGLRRGIATAALAVGLLVVGGTAVVLAADPSASPAPGATTQPSTGSRGSTRPNGGAPNGQAPTGKTHDCPNMGGSGSGGSSGSGSSSSPSTNGATSSPSSNL
jgi:hypothetical protein